MNAGAIESIINYICICMYGHAHVYFGRCLCTYACAYMCVYVCMYVCMYACM